MTMLKTPSLRGTPSNKLQSWIETPDDTSVHPKGLALLLNQPIRFNSLERFDRGIVYSACTVVVRAIAGNPSVLSNMRQLTY